MWSEASEMQTELVGNRCSLSQRGSGYRSVRPKLSFKGSVQMSCIKLRKMA
jgi:hypothetical protein